MHVDTTNAVHPLTSMFGLLTRAGYSVGAFGKVTNDQGNVLQKASEWNTMEYIDSPVNYNSFMGLPCEDTARLRKAAPVPPVPSCLGLHRKRQFF